MVSLRMVLKFNDVIELIKAYGMVFYGKHMSGEQNRKTIWLEEGLKILAAKGPAALSMESLTQATGKTKGSFYYHFSSGEKYVEQLLEYYEKNNYRRDLQSWRSGK